MRLSAFERVCLLVVALAALLRVSHVVHPQPDWDAAWYLLLARSFAQTGTSLLPWTEPPQVDGYWPPLFPLFAAPFVKLFGPSYPSLVAAGSFAAALLVAAAFFCTRDLYGRKAAFGVMAAVAASPAFYVSDARGMSESLLALMVTLALWAFLRGLERPRFLGLAAVFGALAYLAKASLGIALLAPVVAIGLAWRVASVGPRAWLRRRVEVGLALAAFAALLVLALARPSGIGSVGLGVIGPVRDTFSAGPAWLGVFALKLAFAAVFLAFVTLPFSLAAPAAWRARRGEREGALWLATALPLAAGALFTTTFYFAQDRPLVDFDNIRYLVPAIVPFLWLTAPRFLDEAREQRQGQGQRWVVASAIALALVFALSPFAVTPSLPRLAWLGALTFAALALALPAARPMERGLPVTPMLGGLALAAGAAYFLWPVLPAPWRAVLVLAIVVASLALAIEWRRLVRARWSAVALAALVPFLAFHVSMWFAMVAAGLLVARLAPAATTQALVMALVLLVSAAPAGASVAPDDEIAAALRGLALAPGTVVGIDEPPVYVAAIVPEGLRVRVVADPDAAPPDVRAMVLTADLREHAGFVRVATFRDHREPNELLAARLAIERAFGVETPLEGRVSAAVYVRN